MGKRLHWEVYHDPIEDLEDDDDFEDFDDKDQIVTKINPVLATPLGFFPLRHTVDRTGFNLWIAHTDFDIDQNIANIIDCVPGVEVLTVTSRYSFIISVGRLFNSADVKLAIQKALNITFDSGKPANETVPKAAILDIQEKIRDLKTKYNHWCLYFCPNGNIDVFGSDEETEVATQLDTYYKVLNAVGGAVYSSCSKSPEFS